MTYVFYDILRNELFTVGLRPEIYRDRAVIVLGRDVGDTYNVSSIHEFDIVICGLKNKKELLFLGEL